MRRLLLAVTLLAVPFIIGVPGCNKAKAQAIPPQPAVSCEQNLDQARAENIALRKQLAQTMFQAAALEEHGIALKKQVDAANAKDKAAEKK